MKHAAINLSPLPATGAANFSRAGAVPLGAILGLLFASFALDNILLLGFLGHSRALVWALALGIPPVVGWLTARTVSPRFSISLRTVAICFAVAVLLLLLGGEGRLFFATDDWQIRDAVLTDMATHAWPFDYWLEGKAQMLRAPVGMYLLPALLGSASQAARDFALLAHNSLILGLILSAGAALFEGKRARLIALVIFVMFSGLDVIGNGLAQLGQGHADWEHIERWADNHQFSAHITQIFWVPHHALASWACALSYALWRRGLAGSALLGASMALVAIWSPFAIFGALPFAIYLVIRVLITRSWTLSEIALGALGIAIALPSLLYLRTDAASVGSGFRAMPLLLYLFVIGFEILPFLAPLLANKSGRTDRATLLIAGVILLAVPLWAIGPGPDFQMRTSIMALALVALALADWAISLRDAALRIYLLVILSLGSVTGTVELYRALTVAPSPPPRCSVVGVWQQQTNTIVPYASYFAPRTAFSSQLVSSSMADRAGRNEPLRCWERPWRQTR